MKKIQEIAENGAFWGDLAKSIDENFAECKPVDVIKTTDEKEPTDSNVFSALRSLATFLRKDKADSTSHLLTLLAGAVFGDNKASIDANGLLTAVNAIIKGDVKSDNFLAGALGSGYALLKKDADGKSYLEVDKLFARVKAIFAILEIMKVTYTGGNFVFSPAGMQCTKVEEYDTYYRCYFTADDGEKAVENTFEVDDFVQLREFNVKPGVYENVSNRYFWRRCIAKGDDYIDLSKADRDMTSNDAPMVGDSLVTIGNKTIKSRQNVIIISVYGEGSPSIIQYAGVNDYSLDGKAVTVISPSGNKFTGSFVIEATGKSVEDELSVAVEVADAAQKAADKAQEDADTANSELGMIASDNYITPSEKTALKQQQADIQAERNEIIANATRYGVSYSAYDTAYTAANNALTYYSGATPTNIPVNSDYLNISAYYAARKTILDAIAAAAKKLVTDLDDDLQGYKSEVTQKFEAVDGRFTSAINETKTYTDNAVGNIQVGNRNLLLNSGEKIIPNSTNYFVHRYESAEQFKPEEKYTVVIKGSTSAGQAFGLWINGAIAYAGEFPRNMQGEVVYKHISIPSGAGTPSVSTLHIYNKPNPNGVSKPCEIEWVAMYEGHIKPPMDWSPATEDLTTRIEQNSSKIEQLPDQISLTVKKEITGGGFNYITNTQGSIEITGDNTANQTKYEGWKMHPSIAGKKFGAAFKVKFEGCTFSSSSAITLQGGNRGGWGYMSLVNSHKVSENKEYVFYQNTNTAPSVLTDYGSPYIRVDYVSGGKITISEIRAYDVPEGLTDALPWYPSKWDTEVLSSEIKQTSDSITLTVEKEVGNLPLDGYNLIGNSDFLDSTTGWSFTGDTSIAKQDTPTRRVGINILKVAQTAATGTNMTTRISCLLPSSDGPLSFSAYIKADKATTLYVYLGGSIKTFEVGTSWTYIEFNNIANTDLYLRIGLGSVGTWWLSEPMVVKGSKAISWQKSVYEQRKEVSKIKQTSNSISLSVSSLRSDLKDTGIDILRQQINITADKLNIKTNSGRSVAVFDGTGDTPKLKTENIDVDKLIVKQINGNETTMGQWKIIEDGVFESAITDKIKIRISPGFDFIHISDEGSYQNFKIYKDGSGTWKLTITDYSGSCDYTAEGLLPEGGNGSWKYSHNLQYKDGNRFYNVGIDSSGYLKLLDY